MSGNCHKLDASFAVRSFIGLILGVGLVAVVVCRLTPALLSNLAFVQMAQAISVEGIESLPLATPASPLLRGNLQYANARFRAALKRSPDNREALYGLGYLAMASGDFEAAANAFRRLGEWRQILIFPWKMVAFGHTGELAGWSQERREAAGRELAALAYRYATTGKRSDGIVLSELATEIAPGLVESWLDQITLYANEWEHASRSYQQVQALFPDDPYVMTAGAYLALYAQQDINSARSLAEKATANLASPNAAQLSRVRATWLYNLYVVNGDLAVLAADRDLARSWLIKASELPVNSYQLHVVTKRLSQLDAPAGASPANP